jgi:hypothetical protein
MLLENTFNAGITYDDRHIFIVQATAVYVLNVYGLDLGVSVAGSICQPVIVQVILNCVK